MPLAPASLALSLLFAFQASGGGGDWQKVTSRAGGFSVTLPGKVEQKTVTQKIGEASAPVRLIVSESGGVTYIATGTVSPVAVTPDKQSAYFDNVRESYVTDKGKTLQKEQRGTFRGMPICFFRATQTDAKGRAVVEQTRFIIGDPTNLYTMQVFIPKGMDANQDVHKFFSSFRRTESSPASGSASKGEAKSPAAGNDAGPALALKWRPFAPPGKGFSASMPGEPKHTNQDAPDGSVKIETYVVALANRQYTVACYEFPPAVAKQPAEATLENMCNGMVTGMEGAVDDLKPVQADGVEGREVLFNFPGPKKTPAIGRARAFLNGTRAYVVMFNGPEGSDDDEDAATFLDSFRQTKPAGAPKAKAKFKAKSGR